MVETRSRTILRQNVTNSCADGEWQNGIVLHITTEWVRTSSSGCKQNTVERQWSGLIGTASYTDKREIKVIGFFKQATLTIWSSAVNINGMHLRLNISNTSDMKF